jgi:hypothetical protein
MKRMTPITSLLLPPQSSSKTAFHKRRSVDPQERPQTELEYQAALEVAQQGIALQLKRRKRDLVFELSRPLAREQAAWLGEHVGKLFDSYCIKDELEVQLDAPLEEARDNRKAAAHE